jgi:hypothetical protein
MWHDLGLVLLGFGAGTIFGAVGIVLWAGQTTPRPPW